LDDALLSEAAAAAVVGGGGSSMDDWEAVAVDYAAGAVAPSKESYYDILKKRWYKAQQITAQQEGKRIALLNPFNE
jgi:hypothetical protein